MKRIYSQKYTDEQDLKSNNKFVHDLELLKTKIVQDY